MTDMQTEIVLAAHERLRIARQRAGLEQADMADLLGVHRAVVSRYENGHTEPTLSALVKWADVADVSLDWLCARRDSNPQPSDLYSSSGADRSYPVDDECWTCGCSARDSDPDCACGCHDAASLGLDVELAFWSIVEGVAS